MPEYLQKYSIQVGVVCRDCILFDNVATIHMQCPKRNVNGYDILVSMISNFQRWLKFQFIKLYWNVIIFEKLIVSLNILVD